MRDRAIDRTAAITSQPTGTVCRIPARLPAYRVEN
jgi:hypothetical protein